MISRDPFVGKPVVPAAIDPPLTGPPSPPQPAVANDTAVAAAGPGDVPDIASGTANDVASSARPELVIKATIAGPHPVAYVASGADMEVVRIGDTLAGHESSRSICAVWRLLTDRGWIFQRRRRRERRCRLLRSFARPQSIR